MVGLLGKKIGMTHIFDEQGAFVPVTLIEAGPCYVTQVKTKDVDGYSAIQLGFCEKKEKSLKKVDAARFKKAGVKPMRFLKEFEMSDVALYKPGQKLAAEMFAKGDFVDVRGLSIGRGFQGGVKRWGWAGGDQGHGSMFHRAPGSIQSGARLSRVTKGHHLPGHMGADNVTVQNLEIMKVDADNNIVLVKGSVPGHKNSLLILKEARKRPKGFVKYKAAHAATPKKGAKAPSAAQGAKPR